MDIMIIMGHHLNYTKKTNNIIGTTSIEEGDRMVLVDPIYIIIVINIGLNNKKIIIIYKVNKKHKDMIVKYFTQV